MSGQRRDDDHGAAESVERIWQIYADQIGIPHAEPASSSELAPRPSERPVRSVAVTAARVGGLLAAVAVVVVALMAGIAFWHRFSTSVDTADRQSPTVASVPAGEGARLGQPSVPSERATEALRAPTPAVPAPTEIAAPLPVQRNPDKQVTGVLPAGTEQESTEIVDRINFDFGSDRITEEAKRALDKIVVAMSRNPDWRGVIEGHTDGQGRPDYNQALSERRAQAVKAYLERAGIAPGRLSAAGFGASRPVGPNAAWRHGVNRRVEFRRQ
jgi:outer membrane protein OmpA-like peptidoglycan-associated protein